MASAPAIPAAISACTRSGPSTQFLPNLEMMAFGVIREADEIAPLLPPQDVDGSNGAQRGFAPRSAEFRRFVPPWRYFSPTPVSPAQMRPFLDSLSETQPRAIGGSACAGVESRSRVTMQAAPQSNERKGPIALATGPFELRLHKNSVPILRPHQHHSTPPVRPAELQRHGRRTRIHLHPSHIARRGQDAHGEPRRQRNTVE